MIEFTIITNNSVLFDFFYIFFTATVQFRPLLWTNGPSPGLLFYPKPGVAHNSDGQKGQWMPHKQNEGMKKRGKKGEKIDIVK